MTDSENISMKSKKSLYHFYHIWVGGHWQFVVSEHLHALRTYGLLDALDRFYIGLVGSPEEREIAKQFLRALNFDHIIIAEADSGFEQVTQQKLYEFSLNNNGYVLYAHNKGCWNRSELNEGWRKSMTYYNIVKWKDATSFLLNFDAVGCHWLTPQKFRGVCTPFFGGNFWWTHLSHIKYLGLPKLNTRYDAETWIGNLPAMTVHDLCPGWPHPSLFTTIW